jgi:hypothetical protein
MKKIWSVDGSQPLTLWNERGLCNGTVTEARGNRQGYGFDSLIRSATWCLVADNNIAELEQLGFAS